ncbi:MAG TPA: RNA polymerase sigma factor region1.1 domain-containing protein, partial [Leptospiraceae bacterium]|nr:RNA polymerase sigma factor region1.1 domain-containing protein [Leptospiraceae bacterium]
MSMEDLPEIQKIISIGKANGEITYDEINEYLPEKIVNSEWIEDVFTLLNQMGIEVVEEYSSRPQEEVVKKEPPAKARKKKDAPANSSDDPIRLYLKEIGRVSLISGDKEVFLARRIENGENIIEETILESSLLRANFMKLLPKIRSRKIKIIDVVRANKAYYMSTTELEKL